MCIRDRDYTKCPNCKKMTFHPDGYCENCGYGKSANEDGANHSSECANCGSATINAVSYTHLDVYKRQY